MFKNCKLYSYPFLWPSLMFLSVLALRAIRVCSIAAIFGVIGIVSSIFFVMTMFRLYRLCASHELWENIIYLVGYGLMYFIGIGFWSVL